MSKEKQARLLAEEKKAAEKLLKEAPPAYVLPEPIDEPAQVEPEAPMEEPKVEEPKEIEVKQQKKGKKEKSK